jgi:hypothetical protein
MRLIQNRNYGWKVPITSPPMLTKQQWDLANLLAVVLIIMAVLQLISFADFRDGLATMGLSAPSIWAVVVILAELWAAAGFFRWRLSYGFRLGSTFLAVAVAAFWFIVQAQTLSNGAAEIMHSSFLFGHYLNQTPGWWTLAEVTALLFLSLFITSLTRLSLINKRR